MNSIALGWGFNTISDPLFNCTISLAESTETDLRWYALRYFFIFRGVFPFKNGRYQFSNTSHSIALFKSYKIIYLPVQKKIGHLGNCQAHYTGDIISYIFDWYSPDFCQNTYVSIRNNNIFDISIKNWRGNIANCSTPFELGLCA